MLDSGSNENGIDLYSEGQSSYMSGELKEEHILRFRGKARKLARSILRKWRARLDLTEVDSIVDLSLCEAADRFNPERGASFMTFLFYHLRGNLIRAISSAVSSTAIPFLEVDSLLAFDEGIDGSRAGVNAIEIAQALTSQESLSPEEIMFRKEMSTLSHQSFQRLDTLEKDILTRLFGTEQQMIDIAHDLGYSRCHISRVKRKALESLFTEMSSLMKKDDIKLTRPDFDEEDSRILTRRVTDRRKTVRRRARSRTSTQVRTGTR